MANLWRTQRPRFPLYESDGFGRDYYIKYTNGGYWEDQFILTKKPNYERYRYKNFHTLYHLAAPLKYWGDGSGRTNYIIKYNGFHHDEKPLYTYQLTDFLRNDRNIQGVPYNIKKKVYFSVSEAKYNQKLKNLEKRLVKRLYTEPMKKRKKLSEINDENIKDCDKNDNKNNLKDDNLQNKNGIKKNEDCFDYYLTQPNNNNQNEENKIKNSMSLDISNCHRKYRNKFHFNNNNHNNFEKKSNDKTYYGNFDHKKAIKMGTLEYISPKNNLKNIDSRGKYNRYLGFKQPSINNKYLLKKFRIV